MQNWSMATAHLNFAFVKFPDELDKSVSLRDYTPKATVSLRDLAPPADVIIPPAAFLLTPELISPAPHEVPEKFPAEVNFVVLYSSLEVERW